MRILLFGKRGQVGWELQRSLAPLGQIVALDCEGQGNLCGDFTDLAGLVACVRAVAPDVIVNAAAHTAVDKAESEPELARTINALAPGILAEEADRLGAWLVHYSTDYVFDGSGDTPWRESDPTGPLGVYGKTKLAGEQAVARCHRHLLFRTSWVYAARGNNFARTMLRLACERERLQVVADQIGAPTGADLIADVTAHALRSVCQRSDLAGLYHLVAGGETSWHGYARHVIEHARQAGRAIRVAAAAIEGVPSSAYPLPAPRPHNSRLDTGKLQAAFGLSLPAWQIGVDRMLAEVLGQ
ncbi:dTDP-4-dehydrorhamnose reductase [Accumulibacter sp.]|jgi:dTDP-4-dehydrorhamnose reductase|uniref:dTDP-4-dehydrorhamnose reductase n=1 Tax=Accumulibacter sp. TaxID=2053492 RepID=UPI001AD0EBFD|nr:dTDP-4-dehydrorhamnose reductase [Accumulibacter sp.]MBN8448992.1 dTDP-4-dehydrorhamnose reductase [Candidatus Accumulibacter necessarius]MBN8495919.1 dTDP-4-dehydrorhamnose reductase [Accumulibacter sp.]